MPCLRWNLQSFYCELDLSVEFQDLVLSLNLLRCVNYRKYLGPTGIGGKISTGFSKALASTRTGSAVWRIFRLVLGALIWTALLN